MKKYYYIELVEGKAYVLYEAGSARDFSDKKSIIAIGDERTVKNAVVKNLPKECVIMYHTLKEVKLAKDGTVFELEFKKYLTKNFTEYKKEDKTQ
jgi:hypothetical protein